MADHKTPAAPREGEIQGEGDYVAGRRFQDAERSFVKKGGVERKAHEAAEALDGPEAAELEEARRTSAEGDIHAAHEGGDGSNPHTEENLDHGLDETFPASDPVSIHPGAD